VLFVHLFSKYHPTKVSFLFYKYAIYSHIYYIRAAKKSNCRERGKQKDATTKKKNAIQKLAQLRRQKKKVITKRAQEFGQKDTLKKTVNIFIEKFIYLKKHVNILRKK